MLPLTNNKRKKENTMSDKIKITVEGKEIEVTEIQPGVVQKSESIYYVQDSVSKEWLYCYPTRLDTLRIKYDNDLSAYKGRETRAAEREQEKKDKIENAAKKAEARAAKAAERLAATNAAIAAKAAKALAAAAPVVPPVVEPVVEVPEDSAPAADPVESEPVTDAEPEYDVQPAGVAVEDEDLVNA
jgi:hypothetical protein